MWEILIFINFSPVQKQFLVIGGDSKNGTDREIQLINMEKDVFHSGDFEINSKYFLLNYYV